MNPPRAMKVTLKAGRLGNGAPIDPRTLPRVGRRKAEVPEKNVEELKTAARKYIRAQRSKDAAYAELVARIIDAAAAGGSPRTIAPLVGLSHQRVDQIIRVGLS